jgi:hypothetical protein
MKHLNGMKGKVVTFKRKERKSRSDVGKWPPSKTKKKKQREREREKRWTRRDSRESTRVCCF